MWRWSREPVLRPQWEFVLGLLALTVGVRLLPYGMAHFGLSIHPDSTIYPWNFSPLPAVCLFGGACLMDRRWSVLLPMIVLLVGDLGIWALSGRRDWAFYPDQPLVYASYATIGLLGLFLRPHRPSWTDLPGDAGTRRRTAAVIRYVLPLAAVFGLAALVALDLRSWATIGRLEWSWWQPCLYVSCAGLLLLSRLWETHRAVALVGGTGLAGSVLFFVVTNFGVWLLGDGVRYPHTPAGLADCYVQAIPFFRNWMVGMGVFLPILFSPLAVTQREVTEWEAEALVPVRHV